MDKKQPAVYILTSKKGGPLYIGVTSNLAGRVYQHKNNQVDGFSKRYNLHLLVYYELHDQMYNAISREKKLKKWNRSWKVELIEKCNSDWLDLFDTLF